MVEGDDKRRARLNCIAHLLSMMPVRGRLGAADQASTAVTRSAATSARRSLYHYVPDHAASLTSTSGLNHAPGGRPRRPSSANWLAAGPHGEVPFTGISVGWSASRTGF